MIRKTVWIAALALVGASTAFASELDAQTAAHAPKGLIVRATTDGKSEVYRVDLKSDQKFGIADDAAAKTAIAQFVNSKNLIQGVKEGTELDQETSHEAWCRWYGGFGYTPYSYYYSYLYGGYNWYYYPYYLYNSLGYYYYFYW